MKWMVNAWSNSSHRTSVQRSLRCTPPQPGRETYLERRDGRNVPTHAHAPDPMRKVAVFERRVTGYVLRLSSSANDFESFDARCGPWRPCSRTA